MDRENNDLDPENIELIINDLKTSFDNLEHGSLQETQGFQVKLAKTIASLRMLKASKIEAPVVHPKVKDETETKTYLLNQLDFFIYLLDQLEGSSEEVQRKKFDLIMKIAKLREKIGRL